MEYGIIEPPSALNFREMSKKQLEAYRAWFHDVMPERMKVLTNAVSTSPGYEDWLPDMTLDSLETLGEWFDAHVQTRQSTEVEREAIQSKLRFPIDVPEDELTDQTFSLAMDIGMYLGQVVLKTLDGTCWGQPLKNKKFADYGQPVLTGFGTVPLNPVRVLVMTAYGVSRGQAARLRELYDVWARMAVKPSSQ